MLDDVTECVVHIIVVCTEINMYKCIYIYIYVARVVNRKPTVEEEAVFFIFFFIFIL